jgi:hypothetical protein
MIEKDDIGVVQRYIDDKKVGITFNQMIDSDGEGIVAEVYVIGSSVLQEIVNAAGFTTLGGLKGEKKTVVCDFSALTPSSNFSLKFRTASGVVAKAALVIFADDAFTTQSLSDDEIGIYQPFSARLIEIAALSPAANSFIIGNSEGTGWESDTGDTLRGRLGSTPVSSGAVQTLGDALFNVFTGTVDRTWEVPLIASFWLVANRSSNGSNLYLDNASNPNVVHNSDPFWVGPGEVKLVWSDGTNIFVI